ncbi:hypothetical protein AV530_009393 [Patagioenas fasciata monilis]|uniref:Uncharacterized protein n=1 Tax=Patagioenas fasciata monilis TaxID=372326 RepID=A0A1V4JIS9_PATFA|nr:hypothetical protein AV530_009393 [Patagioenas fasciata monilis]
MNITALAPLAPQPFTRSLNLPARTVNPNSSSSQTVRTAPSPDPPQLDLLQERSPRNYSAEFDPGDFVLGGQSGPHKAYLYLMAEQMQNNVLNTKLGCPSPISLKHSFY